MVIKYAPGCTHERAQDYSSYQLHHDFPDLPDYDHLPLVPGPGERQRCTWGLWDEHSTTPDQLGMLNLLTPGVVKAAGEEVEEGISVALNWSMNNCQTPHSNRRKPEHRIFTLREGGGEWIGHDDEVHFNTQGGSQWDGFRHWAHQPTGLHYNGLPHEDIMDKTAPQRNGIDEWSKRGGIVGRGVLLDYLGWAELNHVLYSPIERHSITVDELEQIAKHQDTNLRPGDILLIRSGFVKWHNEASPSERVMGTANGTAWAGVEGSERSVRWFWDRRFAAVGGDANVFECWPASSDKWRLHDNLIALLGMPVGEMFDLERLAKECARLSRWSFLFTSAPLNFPGGVASPPNAICVL